MRITAFGGALAVGAMLLCGPTEARAGFITGQLWQNVAASVSTNALLGYGQPTSLIYLGTPDAKFDSGAFNYDSGFLTTHAYTPAGFLNNPTFTNTSGAFNPNGSLNNTYFYFTGTISLNAGVNSFVVAHDDGLQLNIDGIGLVVNQPGPTSPTFTPFMVTAPSAGNYSFQLSFGECCGPPSVLQWSVNGVIITSVPGPAGLVLYGVGLAGFPFLLRRRQAG